MSKSSETESEIISLPKYIFNLFVSTINDLIEIKSQYDIWGGYFKESDENSKWYLKRFPYKPIYGIPDSLDCDQSIRQRFNECEILSHKEWDVSINEYFYITRRFCCFVWDSMHCEYNIAAKCDEEYAKKLRNITLESFEKACDTISATDGSFCCLFSLTFNNTFKNIVYVLTFIIMFIVISYRINDACNYAKKLKIMNNNNQNMSDGPTNFRNVRSKSISQFQFDNKTDTLNVRRTLSAPTLSVPPTPPPQPPSQQTSIVSTPTNFGNVRSKSISQFQFDNKTDTLNVRRTLSAPIIPTINLNAYNNINTATSAIQSDDSLNKVFVQPQSSLSSLSSLSSSITDQISDVNIIQSGSVDRMLTNSNQIL